jgi:predicted phage terminase large subunit-like protein
VLPSNLSALDARAHLIELDRIECEESIYVFLKSAWHIWDPAPWIDGWCIDAIGEHLQAVVDGQIKRLCINIPPRSSKPIGASALVPTLERGLIPLREIFAGLHVLTHRGRFREVKEVHRQGELSVLRMTTRSGRQITAAHDHPFLTTEGWEELGKIKHQDIVGTIPQYIFDRTVRGEIVDEISESGTEECLCLTVDEDESFVANGFAVHNSALCSVALTAWTWIQRKNTHTSGPGVSFLYASYLDKLSLQDSMNCRKIIESRWYQERWGDRFALAYDQNTKSRFNNDKGGYRMVTSVESKGSTGFGANIIVLDDCNSASEVESDAVTQSTTDWFDGTLGTRFNNQKLGAVVQIQQRVGERDLTGHIQSKNKGEWDFLILPMEFETWRKSNVTSIGWSDPRTEEGELLWPERFDAQVVQGLKDWMLPWRAAGQLQQRPAPKGGGIIERDWWRLWDAEKFPAFDFILATLDTAYTEDQMNDPSGMIIWGVFSTPVQEYVDDKGMTRPVPTRVVGSDQTKQPMTLNPTDARAAPKVMMIWAWEKYLKLHDLVVTTAEACTKYKVDLLLIENKASGISVSQELRRLFANSKFGIQMSDPKSQDKVARLNAVAPLFYEGLVYAPPETYPWVDAVISQIERFPRSRHDEFVDCTSMGIRHLRENNLICRVVERQAEIEELKAYRGREQPLYSV